MKWISIEDRLPTTDDEFQYLLMGMCPPVISDHNGLSRAITKPRVQLRVVLWSKMFKRIGDLKAER